MDKDLEGQELDNIHSRSTMSHHDQLFGGILQAGVLEPISYFSAGRMACVLELPSILILVILLIGSNIFICYAVAIGSGREAGSP